MTRHVRDATYWGLPIGTPIVAGMRPARAKMARGAAPKAAVARPTLGPAAAAMKVGREKPTPSPKAEPDVSHHVAHLRSLSNGLDKRSSAHTSADAYLAKVRGAELTALEKHFKLKSRGKVADRRASLRDLALSSAPSVSEPKVARGRDLSQDADYEALAHGIASIALAAQDGALADIWRQQGFDGHPQVVSAAEYGRLAAAGDVRDLWRGVTGHGVGNAEQYAEQFRSGTVFPGTGIYGNGTYVALTRSKAEQYAGPNGAIMRIGLRKDARVVSAAQLDKLMSAAIGKEQAETSKRIAALDRQMLSAYDRAKTAEARTAVFEKFSKLKTETASPRFRVQQDPGRFAALLGYDAIDVPASWKGTKDHVDQLVILNRTATIVEAG